MVRPLHSWGLDDIAQIKFVIFSYTALAFQYHPPLEPRPRGDEEVAGIPACRQYNLTAACNCTHCTVGRTERKVRVLGAWWWWWWCRSDNAGTLNDPSRSWVWRGWLEMVGEDGWSGDVQPLTSLPQCLKLLSKRHNHKPKRRIFLELFQTAFVIC